MQEEIEYKVITKEIYNEFYEVLCNFHCGIVLLPSHWAENLWGIVGYRKNSIVSGWVGRQRLSGFVTKFYQEVVFDNIPFLEHYTEDSYNRLINETIRLAKKYRVISLSMSHWCRNITPMKHNAFISNKTATFISDLSFSEEELWKFVDSKQRNIIRKGIKNEVNVIFATQEQSLTYLDTFQKLRSCTQARAIRKNSQATMLLKSDTFFRDLMLNKNSILCIAEYESNVIAVALIIISGNTAFYYSGGSSYEINAKVGGSAFLLWNAMIYSKNMRCEYFDFGGVPIAPTKSHPAYGIYSFKKSFGGEYKEFFIGDFVLNKWEYQTIKWLKNRRKLLRLISQII